MSYTQVKDERIDNKIDEQLKVVCEEILKITQPVSIILFGGFGRGEGSAHIIDNKIIVSKDYDTLLVVKRRLSPSVIYKMSENIHKCLGLENPLDLKDMSSGVSLVQYTLNDFLYFRDAKTYEIKTASKLLWGEDIREKIPLKPEDLSPWNGIRYLLRKPPGLCYCSAINYLTKPPTAEEKKTLVHECHRVYLDGGVLLTILAGMYRPTYRERATLIKESLAERLPDLVERIPDLIDKIVSMTNSKLFPSEEKYEAIDPVKLWFETRKDLGIILRYFMEHYLGVKTQGLAELFEMYNTRMNKEFVDELAYFYLKQRFKIASKPLSRLANIAYQRLFCLKYVLKLRKKRGLLYLKALNEFPTFKVCTSGLMLLFSLNEDGTLDEDLFNSFVESLGRLYPVNIRGTSDAKRWQEAEDSYITADRIFLDTFYGWG